MQRNQSFGMLLCFYCRESSVGAPMVTERRHFGMAELLGHVFEIDLHLFSVIRAR